MISVCLATYNGEKYLREQLDSILCQLSGTDEIIISDDGSKDATIKIINSFNDNRIHLYHNQGKHGVVSNFENALAKASGDFIFLSDQDDVWMNDKVEKCIRLLNDYDLIVHNAEIVNGNCENTGHDFFSLRDSKGGFWNNIYKNRFVGCCMSFKKQLLNYVLPFPSKILWHDMWIGLIAEKHFKVYFSPIPLIMFRRHGGNTSQTSEKSNFTFFKKISYRFWMFFYSLFH